MYVVEIDPGALARDGVGGIAGWYGPFHSRSVADEWAERVIRTGAWSILQIKDPDSLKGALR